jgi:tRNA pseudouridine38-40 synthase
MARYFIAVGYMGTRYAGFQVQENANSVQQEVERALQTYFRVPLACTCSSRTDAGVHAYKNFFHLDAEFDLTTGACADATYHLNAILPDDIVVRNIIPVPGDLHARYDARWREYHYHIYRKKDPFLRDRAFYYPYTLDRQGLEEAAALIPQYEDFEAFSKRRSQVNHFRCTIHESRWRFEEDRLIYAVRANRFLRGMVKGLVGTMLRVGSGKMTLEDFRQVIEGKDQSRADFSVPSKGLFLMDVGYEFPGL